MSKPDSIPQHELRNESGNAISFDLIEWGGHQGYDHQKPHRHEFHEILIFKEGGGKHDIDFTTYHATRGTVHFVASDNVHVLLREKSTEGYSLVFATDYVSGGLIAQLPFSKSNPVLHLDEANFTHLDQLVSQIKAEYAHRQPCYEDMIKAYMQALLLHLLRIYQRMPEHDPESSLPPHVDSFLTLVDSHYMQHHTVEIYAGKLHISNKHLIDLCKKSTGKTPLQHIRLRTTTEAKRLLFNTKLSIKEIAHQLKFGDSPAFVKYFKAATGFTPAAYRKAIR